MRFLRSLGELGLPVSIRAQIHATSDVTGGWVERLWFGAQVGDSSEPLPMRVFLRRSGVNVPCETTAMPPPMIAAADANGPESQACPLPHIGRLGPIRTHPIEAGRRNVSRPSCQRSVGVRRVITGGITEHHRLSVGFRRLPRSRPACSGQMTRSPGGPSALIRGRFGAQRPI